MPQYDYRCPACNESFEVSRPMGSTEPACCPVCGEPGKRVFTPVGVAFKGTGFHNTDYKPRASDDAPGCPSKSDSSEKCASCPSAK